MGYLTVFCASGGGAKGSFQVGVLEAITRLGIHLDGLVGVSTGSIQSGFMSMAEPGLEPQRRQVELLKHIWFSIKDESSIYSKPSLGLAGLAWQVLCNRSSLYSFEPLQKLLLTHVQKGPQRPVRLGVVHLNSGEFTPWRPRDAGSLRAAILASASIPVAFPPVPPDLVDGGVREIAPLSSAFDLANEMYQKRQTAKDVDRIRIILALASPLDIQPQKRGSWSDAKAFEIALRSIELLESENYIWDVEGAVRMNELVAFFDRHPDYERPACLKGKLYADLVIIEPDYLPFTALDFNPARIREFWQHGLEKATKILTPRVARVPGRTAA